MEVTEPVAPTAPFYAATFHLIATVHPMSDLKTTTAGALIVAAASANLIAHALAGGVTTLDLQNLLSALAGIGLIMAKDAK